MLMRSRVYNMMRDIKPVDGVRVIRFYHLDKHGLRNDVGFVVAFMEAGGFSVERVGGALVVRAR